MQHTLIKERPILMSAPMVRAILDGKKTQTRRVVKVDNIATVVGRNSAGELDNDVRVIPSWQMDLLLKECPYGKPGERLWCVTIKPIAFGGGGIGVGDDGNVYDISGTEPRRRRVRLSHNGYEEITLRSKGQSKSFRVNKLVCEAFYGEPPTSLTATGEVIEVRHLDGSRRNNLPENLDWGTRAQNAADAAATGTWSGSRNSAACLSEADVAVIRAAEEPQAVLAERYGVSQPTISKIRSGRRWSETRRDAPPPNTDRWSSRILLEIVSVRVERVQDISVDAAIAEGIYREWDGTKWWYGDTNEMTPDPRKAFLELFYDINKRAPRSENPWVWAIEFKRLEPK